MLMEDLFNSKTHTLTAEYKETIFSLLDEDKVGVVHVLKEV